MNFIIKIILSTFAVIVTSYLLPTTMVHVDSVKTAIIVALVLAFLNALVKPVMVLLTLPATVFTLGLFLLVINALIVKIADHFIDGFKIYSFWSAIIFSIILTLTTSIFEALARNSASRN